MMGCVVLGWIGWLLVGLIPVDPAELRDLSLGLVASSAGLCLGIVCAWWGMDRISDLWEDLLDAGLANAVARAARTFILGYCATILVFAGVFIVIQRGVTIEPLVTYNGDATAFVDTNTPQVSAASTNGETTAAQRSPTNERSATRLISAGDFLFFSLTTITTVGMSTLRPNAPFAKFATAIELLAGTWWVVVAATVILGGLRQRTRIAEQKDATFRRPSVKWEYLQVLVQRDRMTWTDNTGRYGLLSKPGDWRSLCNLFGEDGWELVTAGNGGDERQKRLIVWRRAQRGQSLLFKRAQEEFGNRGILG